MAAESLLLPGLPTLFIPGNCEEDQGPWGGLDKGELRQCALRHQPFPPGAQQRESTHSPNPAQECVPWAVNPWSLAGEVLQALDRKEGVAQQGHLRQAMILQ